MRKLYSSVAACAAIAMLAMGQRGVAQDVFTLGFEGAASQAGEAGAVKADTYYATLGQTGTGNGAQGWSLSLSAEGATLTGITTAGTIADKVENGGLWEGGFNKTEVIDPAKNGGSGGAVSGVVLSLTEGTTLPANTTQRIAKMGLDAKIPAGGGVAKLLYLDGLRGSGQPVNNVVTQDGDSQTPVKSPLTINLVEVVSCCDDPVNVGFSGAVIRAGAGFEGIADATELCSAGGGEIQVQVAEGSTGAATAYANVVSNLQEGGVQGWSFSILVSGADVDLVSSTTAGTAADKDSAGGLWNGGFNKTQIVDPALNGDRRGTVSGVVLSLTEGTTLPFVGTESVLAIGLASKAPQGDTPQVGTLAFVSGLRGSGQPVNNVVTVGGDSKAACNFATAEVDVVFIKRLASDFIRGNSNSDDRVDIADPIWTINELFRGGQPTVCQDTADANDDGIVDASDAVYMIDYLFRGQASPPPPFPDCGADPTEDELECPESDPAC